MKKGTNVGLDKNYKNVCVGDQIKDADGYIYTIDRYGKAVGKGGSAFQLSEIHPFELYQPDPVAHEPELLVHELPQEALEAIKNHDLGRHIEIRPAIGSFGDQDLADELRRRGYEVKATKTTIVEL